MCSYSDTQGFVVDFDFERFYKSLYLKDLKGFVNDLNVYNRDIISIFVAHTEPIYIITYVKAETQSPVPSNHNINEMSINKTSFKFTTLASTGLL